jgi:hypothetical protein
MKTHRHLWERVVSPENLMAAAAKFASSRRARAVRTKGMAAEAGNVGGCAAEINDREGDFQPPMARIARIGEAGGSAVSISDVGEIRGCLFRSKCPRTRAARSPCPGDYCMR